MAVPSSPIAYSDSPSPPPATGKRSRPDEAPKSPTRPKNRARGGFLPDDESDDDVPAEERSPKRRMLHTESQASSNTIIDLDKDDNDQVLADTTPLNSQRDQGAPVTTTARLGSLFGGSRPLDFSSSWAGNASLRPSYKITTCSGQTTPIKERKPTATVSYESMVAARSKHKEGRAKKSFYGIDIHALMDSATKQIAESEAKKQKAAATAPVTPDVPMHSVEDKQTNLKKSKRTLLWTEKYRARNFMDLVGDDLTNRQVLRWLKRWDPLVFPHSAKKPSIRKQHNQQEEEERPFRKVLMLTGPPGLGKTTLAHVCARQAGYDVLEINASDDRSKDVVKGRIRTTLGTETVKTVANKKSEGGRPKIARPVCVVVDEVDGVVSGAGASGEGGFVKALIDLILIDQKNAEGGGGGRKKKKGDDFRQMRPLILICNDVYHPSLRPLRQSGLAEIIHAGKPTVEAVVVRLKNIFEKEGIPCEKDAARKLCEAAWGMTSGIDAKRGAESNAEGDLRGVMVVGEWVAGRLKATSKDPTPCLTRQWIDKNVLQDLSHGGGGARGLGRGNVREIVTRVFQEGAGFPKQAISTTVAKNIRHEQPKAQLGFSESHKKYAMARLTEMIDTSGDIDRIMTEVMSEYPNREFNDDSFLSKPNAAYEWMHFHDTCASRVFSSQEWELAAYVSQPILACHHLFATSRRYQPQNTFDKKWGDVEETAPPPIPFSGPRANWEAFEAEKVNRAMLQGIQAKLPPTLSRSFRSPEDVATDFLPYLVRLVSPDVKPVLIGGSDKNAAVASVRRESEKAMVKRAALVLDTVGIALHKGKIEADVTAGPVQRTQWVYRMEPDLDTLSTFETAGSFVLSGQAPTRYAVRQVLDQELQKTIAMRESAARQSRFRAGRNVHAAADADDYVFDDKENDMLADKKKAMSEKERLRILKLQQAHGKGAVKKDFFGRVIVEKALSAEERALGETNGNGGRNLKKKGHAKEDGVKVWVTYHEGLNNAVRKPITLEEFMRGF
ncbi:chromosome transmission fidelity protein 18 [Naviculisporaceae sp. PSN 640]